MPDQTAAAKPRAPQYAAGRAVAILAALGAVLIWGAWFPVIRLGALETALTPWDMAFIRMIFPLVMLAPFAASKGLKAGRLGWRGGVLFALTLGPPFAMLMGVGAGLAPASHGAISTPGVFPALVFVVGLFLLGDKATPRRWAGLAAVAAGVGLLALGLSGDGGGLNLGHLCFHAAAWLWCIYIVAFRISGVSAVRGIWIGNAIGALYFLPLYLTVGESGFAAMPVADIVLHAFWQGALAGLAAMLMFNFAIARLGAAEGAAFGALIPAVAALAAIPVLGEIPAWYEIAGAALAGLGVYILNAGRSVCKHE